MGRISMPQGKGSQMHNRREYYKNGKDTPANIDISKSNENVTLVDRDIKDAYREIFRDALQSYNERQKRSDRKIDDYYDHILKSKNGEKPFYEDVVQWGKMEDFKDEYTRQTAKECLVEYVNTFEAENPNLKLIGAYIHMDEASPHLHLDYIPVADGYTRGLEVRNSLDRAMKQMGYVPEKESRQNNATKMWKEHERERFSDICRERGLEVEQERKARGSLSVDEYKEAKESMLGELEKQQSELAFENFTTKMSLKKLQKEKAAAEKQSKELDIEIADKASKNAELDALNAQMTNNMIETQKRLDDAHASLDEVQTQRNQISFDNAVLMLDKDELTKQIDELSQQSKELDTEISDMKSQKAHLERERTEMINSIAKTEKCLDEAYTALDEVSAKNEALISKHDELLQQNEELDQRNKSEREKQKQLRDENKKYIEYVEKNKIRADGIKTTIEVRAAQLKALEDKYNEAVKVVEEHDKLKNEIQELQAELGITKKSRNQELDYQKIAFSDKVKVDKTVLEYARIGKEIKEQSTELAKSQKTAKSIIEKAKSQATEIIKDAEKSANKLKTSQNIEVAKLQAKLDKYERAFSERELNERLKALSRNRSKEHINERER